MCGASVPLVDEDIDELLSYVVPGSPDAEFAHETELVPATYDLPHWYAALLRREAFVWLLHVPIVVCGFGPLFPQCTDRFYGRVDVGTTCLPWHSPAIHPADRAWYQGLLYDTLFLGYWRAAPMAAVGLFNPVMLSILLWDLHAALAPGDGALALLSGSAQLSHRGPVGEEPPMPAELRATLRKWGRVTGVLCVTLSVLFAVAAVIDGEFGVPSPMPQGTGRPASWVV